MNFNDPLFYIALLLAVVFLVAAIVKSILANAERRHMADVQSAAANGGTPEAPVHLESPFNPNAEAAKAAQEPEEEHYAWE